LTGHTVTLAIYKGYFVRNNFDVIMLYVVIIGPIVVLKLTGYKYRSAFCKESGDKFSGFSPCNYVEEIGLRLFTLKNGAIAEQGTFDELMEEKGYFYSLFTVSQR